MKHIQQITPSAVAWNLLVVVALPQREFQVQDQAQGQPGTLDDIISTTNERLQRKICAAPNSTECLQFHRNLQSTIVMTKDQITHIRSLLTAINDIVPHVDTAYTGGRQSRAVMAWMGNLMTYLFGTTNEAQFKVMAQQIADIKNMQVHEFNVLHNSSKHFASYIKLSQDRLDNLMHLVTTSVRDSNRLISEMESNFYQQIEYLNGLLLYRFQLQHHLWSLSTHATNFLTGLEMLSNGQLSTYLTPGRLLQSALDQISHNLQTTHKYRLVNPDAAYLFHNALYSYLRHGSDLFISISIPLTEFQTSFSIYSLEIFPISLPNHHKEKLVQLANLPQVLMVSDDHAYHVELTHTELNTLRLNHFHSQEFLFKTDFKQTCIFAAMQNDHKAIDK